MNWYSLLAISPISIFVVLLFERWRTQKTKPIDAAKDSRKKEGVWPPTLDPLPDITPETLKNYSPIPWRPYKPMDYRLTMGLASLNPSQWIQIDSGYSERIAKRRKLIETYPMVVNGFQPEMVPAIEELYEYLLGYYLPRRYPGLFRVMNRKSDKARKEESVFQNLVTGDLHPVMPRTKSLSAIGSEWIDAVNSLLRAIGTTIEDDILMLLPDTLLPNGSGNPEYKMRALCTCFPSGFNAPGFLGKPLASIHAPVPGYKEKLQMSMDRFFAKILVGKPWRRWNWTITMHDELCTPHGNETYEREVPKPTENDDPAKAQLRVEYQTLTRLPKSQAIIFTVRTYLTSLEQIRNEPPPTHSGTEEKPEPGYGTPNGRGGADDLADAIEGIRGPMMIYKNFHKFSEKVVRYLRTGKKI